MRIPLVLLLALAACATGRSGPRARNPLASLEASYERVRNLHDRLEIASARGQPAGAASGVYALARDTLRATLAQWSNVGASSLGAADRRALEVIRRATESDLTDTASAATRATEPQCAYDPAALALEGFDALSDRISACYGQAVQQVRIGDEVLDRLTVLGALGQTVDSTRRRALFVALDTIWRTVNRDDTPTSPYRQLIRLSAARWRDNGSPVDRGLASLGLEAATVERWLVAVLERWRDATAGQALEPWNYYFAGGAASRRLARAVPLERLRRINDSVYAQLGADPVSLGIHYDLEPRPGKTAVAFTTFGARPRRDGARRATGEPWVFATYRVGGLDNLNELLHETGHGVHIAAIDTRPAFTDWPDSDPFTEAIADLIAQEVYEPAWQLRWLGDSVTAGQGMRSKLSSVMLDICWALFELRMHADPSRDPNVVWTELTRDYLHIIPHPELSWWAMRGQLFNSPGYMMNYALGAIITADIRARARALRGSFTPGDRGWYPWLSERLYRFGLERSTRDVLHDFLGRDLRPDALLEEVSRVR